MSFGLSAFAFYSLSSEGGCVAPLINTHFQVGVATAELNPNRFNGFSLGSPAIAPSAARPGRDCMDVCENRGRKVGGPFRNASEKPLLKRLGTAPARSPTHLKVGVNEKGAKHIQGKQGRCTACDSIIDHFVYG